MSLFRHRTEGVPKGASRRKRRHADPPGGTGPGSSGLPTAGGADAQEQFIIDALNDLRDMEVREVMTPRVDVAALSIPLTLDAISRAVRESGHGSFPVYGENLDDLVGVLFVNDLFRAGWNVGGSEPTGRDPTAIGSAPERSGPDPIDISRRVRQPFLVPESRLVLDLLADMRKQRRAFAVVVDEHGGVEGVLTVKDLLGALVGDLHDEFDTEDEPDAVRVDGNRWLIDGQASVDDVRDLLDITLPEGEYVTLGGFLFAGFGHIPVEGEKIAVDGWELRVAEMDKRRIAKVVAKRLVPPEATPDDGASPASAGGDRTAVG